MKRITLIQLLIILLACILSSCSEESVTNPVNVAPDCFISQPSTGSSFTKGDTIQIQVNASDKDGMVVSVKFYIGNQLVHEDIEAPFSFLWDTSEEPEGEHVISAMAIDDAGAATASDSIIILISSDNLIENRINQLISEYTSQDRFSGMVLVTKNRDIVYEKAFGYADRENGIENSIHSRINICSIGKMFTAVAILKLTEQNRLQLQDNVGEYLAGFPEYISNNVTIHHLLSHTSGFNNYMDHADYDSLKNTEPSIDDLVELIKEESLQFTPGTSFFYSNSGFVLLGAIIEQVTGQEYKNYINNIIFTPLDMTNSSITPNFDCVPYYFDDAGQITPNTGFVPYPSADGGATSTVRDMLKFDQALHSNQLIGQQYVDKMFSPVTYDMYSGVRGYGYGSMIFYSNTSSAGDYSYGHSGGIKGISTMVKHFPASGETLIVFSNYQQVAYEIADRLEVIVFEN